MGAAPEPGVAVQPEAVVTIPAGRRLGAPLPWWLRIAIKSALARLPLPYSWWRRLGVFRHGCLANDAATRSAAFLAHLSHYRRRHDAPPRNVLEIGPGDSVAAALLAKAAGAERICLIDVGRFATDDPAHYQAVLARIAEAGLTPPVLPPGSGVAAVLAAAGAAYRSDGIAGLRALPAASVDFLFSQAVLEHIRRAEFDLFLHESFRVLRPGGLASHVIDLQDHLGGALNHLRFSRALWEHRCVAGGGFYTNRLRYSEICRRAAAAGFALAIPQLVRWPGLPTPRSALDREFRALSDEELCVCGFALVLTRPLGAATHAIAP